VTALVSSPGGIATVGFFNMSAASLAAWGIKKEMMVKWGLSVPEEPFRMEVTVPIRLTMPKTMPPVRWESGTVHLVEVRERDGRRGKGRVSESRPSTWEGEERGRRTIGDKDLEGNIKVPRKPS
jgi:hypothetical protein